MKVHSHISACFCFRFKSTAGGENKKQIIWREYMKCKIDWDKLIRIWSWDFAVSTLGVLTEWIKPKAESACAAWKIRNPDLCKVEKSCREKAKNLRFLICLLFHCWYLIVKKSSVCLLNPMLGEHFSLSKENKLLKWNKVIQLQQQGCTHAIWALKAAQSLCVRLQLNEI